MKIAIQRIKWTNIFLNILIWGFAVLWISPFIGIFMTSVLPYREVILYGWLRIPFDISLSNYITVLTDPLYDLAKGYKNSLIVASIGTIIPMFLAALTAYGFTYFNFTLKTLLFGLILFMLTVPQQLVVIPLFKLYIDIEKTFGIQLIDSLIGISLLHSAWGISWLVFFFKNYFSLIPKSITDAAKVDGASDLTIFFRIILPIAIPGVIAGSLIQFTWVWNDLFYALIFLISPDKYVITREVLNIKGQYHVDWGLLSAGSIIAMTLPLVIYILFNKYFIKGVVGWGVKA
jgi:multiple sugar transport system permease protein